MVEKAVYVGTRDMLLENLSLTVLLDAIAMEAKTKLPY